MSEAYPDDDNILKEEFENLEGAECRVTANSLSKHICWLATAVDATIGELNEIQGTHEVPHDLASHVAPTDQDTSGRERGTLLNPRHANTTTAHETLTAVICPCHDLTHRLSTFLKVVEEGDEVDFEKLHKIFVSTVAYESGLIPHGLKVNILPGASHIRKLLLVRKDGGQCLRHLVNIQESH